MTIQEQYHELAYYTLSHQDKSFIHQHIVDAYTAQTADTSIKPITLVFALAGLYLLIEKKYTGRQVQDAHIQMSKKPKNYVEVTLPESRGSIKISDVLNVTLGNERDEMIHQWCVSVWMAFSEQHHKIATLTEALLSKTLSSAV